MNDHLHEVLYKGFKICIDQDDEPQNPRTEWDNATVMWCFHGRYELGDKNNPWRTDDYPGWDALEVAIIEAEKPIAISRLYLYDHSGITIRTQPFSCPWDSGCVGFIMVTRESYEKCCGSAKRITAKIKKHAEEILVQDTKAYDAYLTGACYCWHVEDEDGERLDDAGCGGVYLGDKESPTSDDNCMIDEAKSAIDWEIENRHKKAKEESDRCQKKFETDFALVP